MKIPFPEDWLGFSTISQMQTLKLFNGVIDQLAEDFMFASYPDGKV